MSMIGGLWGSILRGQVVKVAERAAGSLFAGKAWDV